MGMREIDVPIETVQAGGSRRFRRWQWRMLLSAMFCYLFFYTGRQTFGFAIPGIEDEYGLSKATLGGVSTALLWSYAAGQAINGNLADKLGGRRMMSLGAVLSTIANWAVSFATGFRTLSFGWGANGFVQAMGWPSGSRVLSSWWSRHERGMVFGFYTFAAGCASVLAYVTSVLVIDVYELDWRWIFRIPVLLMLVGGITFYVLARDRPEDAGFPPIDTDEAEDESFVATDSGESSFARYRAVLGNFRILVTGFSIGFQSLARYGLLIWVPVHFLGSDWKEGDSGVDPIWISVALPVGMAVGALSNGYISDRFFGSRRSMPIFTYMVFGCVTSLGMYAVPQQDQLLSMAVLFLAGFFVYGPQSSFWALCPDLAGAARAGTAIGIVNAFAYTFAGIGEPIIGHVLDVTGETSLIFLIVAGACAISATSSLAIRR